MDKPARKNFDKKVHMHIACVKNNDPHKTMSCVYFKDGFAYATDGIVLVKNRLSEMSTFDEAEIAALDGKFLPAEHYKDILKYDECLISEEGFNIKHMERMAKALYNFGECTATLKGINEPIVFDSDMPNVSSVGLLMPIIIKE